MLLKELREQVYEANMLLPAYNLVEFTWGNASGRAADEDLYVIKPSGVAYDDLTPENLVVCDLDGHVVEGDLKPSSDNSTHAHLYRTWGSTVAGIVHTHSTWATSWAQAGRSIPCYGTTHADTFYGSIPCLRELTSEEVATEYELHTGYVITEGFSQCDPVAVPGCLVRSHGPFAWGSDSLSAAHNAAVIEQAAMMAAHTEQINPRVQEVPQYLLDRHYERKHGPNAYYGQAL